MKIIRKRKLGATLRRPPDMTTKAIWDFVVDTGQRWPSWRWVVVYGHVGEMDATPAAVTGSRSVPCRTRAEALREYHKTTPVVNP